MNVIEAAAAYRVHPNTIRAGCKNGSIPAKKEGKSHAYNIELKKPEHQLTVKALADSSDYSPGHIRALIRRKVISASIIGKRGYRIALSESVKLMFLRLGGGEKNNSLSS
jgi:hypothetical protein